MGLRMTEVLISRNKTSLLCKRKVMGNKLRWGSSWIWVSRFDMVQGSSNIWYDTEHSKIFDMAQGSSEKSDKCLVFS